MFDAFIERNSRIARSNQVLIGLRFLFTMVALIVLLIREHDLLSSQPMNTVTPLYYSPPGFVAIVFTLLTIIYLLLTHAVKESPGCRLTPKSPPVRFSSTSFSSRC